MTEEQSNCTAGPQIGAAQPISKVNQLIDEKMLGDLDNIFTYHAPKGDQQDRYVALRENAKDFAKMIVKLCPHSRERSLALTSLQQVTMWANASIAINE